MNNYIDHLNSQNLDQITQADFISDVQDLKSLANALQKEVMFKSNSISQNLELIDVKLKEEKIIDDEINNLKKVCAKDTRHHERLDEVTSEIATFNSENDINLHGISHVLKRVHSLLARLEGRPGIVKPINQHIAVQNKIQHVNKTKNLPESNVQQHKSLNVVDNKVLTDKLISTLKQFIKSEVKKELALLNKSESKHEDENKEVSKVTKSAVKSTVKVVTKAVSKEIVKKVSNQPKVLHAVEVINKAAHLQKARMNIPNQLKSEVKIAKNEIKLAVAKALEKAVPKAESKVSKIVNKTKADSETKALVSSVVKEALSKLDKNHSKEVAKKVVDKVSGNDSQTHHKSHKKEEEKEIKKLESIFHKSSEKEINKVENHFHKNSEKAKEKTVHQDTNKHVTEQVKIESKRKVENKDKVKTEEIKKVVTKQVVQIKESTKKLDNVIKVLEKAKTTLIDAKKAVDVAKKSGDKTVIQIAKADLKKVSNFLIKAEDKAAKVVKEVTSKVSLVKNKASTAGDKVKNEVDKAVSKTLDKIKVLEKVAEKAQKVEEDIAKSTGLISKKKN